MVAQEISDPSWKEALGLLNKLLYESGQLGKERLKQDSLSITNIEKAFSDPSGKVVTKLLWGYYHFYENPYTSLPIERFTEPYVLAKKGGTSEEVKFSIYSILRLYNSEMIQSNGDIVEYLKIFEDRIDDEADEFHFRMNKFQYEIRKNNPEHIDLTEEFMNEFESLMNKFEKDHHFWMDYSITLAPYKRYLGKKNGDSQKLCEAGLLLDYALKNIQDKPYLRYLKFRLYIQLSELARARTNYAEALKYIEEAKSASYLNDAIRAEYWVNRYAANNLFKIGKTDSAFQLLSKADTLRRILDYQTNSLLISQSTWKLQTREKEEALYETRNLLWIVIILLFFISVVYFLLQLNSRKKRMLAIQEKNIQAEKVFNLLKEQELIALNAMIDGQEIERKRIAEDLHDRLGSTLSAVKMHMDVLAEDDPRYDKINRIVNKAVDDTRDIAHNMLSGVLTKFGLMAALQDLRNTLESAGEFQFKLSSIQFDERLDSETEIQIYRIIQELISNTLKHAKATAIMLELRRSADQQVVITYRDNGIGFDPDGINPGMGWKNIKNRTDKIQAELKVDAHPAEGMEVTIILRN